MLERRSRSITRCCERLINGVRSSVQSPNCERTAMDQRSSPNRQIGAAPRRRSSRTVVENKQCLEVGELLCCELGKDARDFERGLDLSKPLREFKSELHVS